jgi:hypothetical protein
VLFIETENKDRLEQSRMHAKTGRGKKPFRPSTNSLDLRRTSKDEVSIAIFSILFLVSLFSFPIDLFVVGNFQSFCGLMFLSPPSSLLKYHETGRDYLSWRRKYHALSKIQAPTTSIAQFLKSLYSSVKSLARPFPRLLAEGAGGGGEPAEATGPAVRGVEEAGDGG